MPRAAQPRPQALACHVHHAGRQFARRQGQVILDGTVDVEDLEPATGADAEQKEVSV